MSNSHVFYGAFFRSRPFTFILTLGGFFVWWLVWWLEARSKKIIVGNGKISYSSGILSKNIVDCKIEKITTLQIRQTFGQRIWGCGDIIVFTAGDIPEIVATGFLAPNKIKQLVDSQS